MKIASKIQREGGSEVSFPIPGSKPQIYRFAPDEASNGDHVCEVVNEDHIARLLAIAEGFEEWHPPMTADELAAFAAEQKLKEAERAAAEKAAAEKAEQDRLAAEAREAEMRERNERSAQMLLENRWTVEQAQIYAAGGPEPVPPQPEIPNTAVADAVKRAEIEAAEKEEIGEEMKADAAEGEISLADARKLYKDVTGKNPSPKHDAHKLYQLVREHQAAGE